MSSNYLLCFNLIQLAGFLFFCIAHCLYKSISFVISCSCVQASRWRLTDIITCVTQSIFVHSLLWPLKYKLILGLTNKLLPDSSVRFSFSSYISSQLVSNFIFISLPFFYRTSPHTSCHCILVSASQMFKQSNYPTSYHWYNI